MLSSWCTCSLISIFVAITCTYCPMNAHIPQLRTIMLGLVTLSQNYGMITSDIQGRFGASLSSLTAAAIVLVLCLCCVIDSVASRSRCQVLICHSLEFLSSGDSVASLSLICLSLASLSSADSSFSHSCLQVNDIHATHMVRKKRHKYLLQ